MGLCVSTYGMSCLGSQLFALDLVHIGFFPSLHGFLHIGSILSMASRAWASCCQLLTLFRWDPFFRFKAPVDWT